MSNLPSFTIWYRDLLRIALSWDLSRYEVESIPMDFYHWAWRHRWHPADALIAAMIDAGLMDEDGSFI